MAAKSKPYEQFGPYILFKKLESDALGDLWRAARIDGNAIGATVALRRLIGGNREAMLASIGVARQVAPLLTGPSFARDQVIDEVGGVPFIAHDYAGGRSLRHVVDRARGGAGVAPNPIPMDQAIVIAEKVALSLATVAELRFAGEKLSHGALLPQFIWISDDGEIRVAGQHLGKGLIGGKAPSEIARYFSPEYQHSGQPTKASEVYSLGAILFLAVTGHEPPDAMSTSAFAAAIRGAKTMTGAPVPDDIKPILDKSLNLDPAMRYANVADMKQALSSLTNSGKYSATTFNLAFYLSSLLKKEFESEAIEREKETKVNVAPYLEAMAEPAASVTPVASVAAAVSASSAPRKSKMPVAIAATVAIALIGAGAFVAFGSKKQVAPAEPVKHLASALPTPPPVRQPVIPEPILSSPVQQTATTGTANDAAAQKKAFEDAVKQKLHAEMMKLQSEYTKQLQQQQSKNAPVPAAPVPAPATTVVHTQPPRQQEERVAEPSAAQLDQRQRDTARQQEAVAQLPATTTQAPPPPAPEPAAAVPQIHEGDVVDVSELDTVPRRTRDPRVIYPPMAARQKIETSVLMSVLVSETGDVTDVKVLRGDDRFGFTDAAVRALRTAKYSPAIKDGKRVKTWLPQMIQFKPSV
ncbi:MAG TPA: TonB family protein [Thermoanaerobaculia bacterium]